MAHCVFSRDSSSTGTPSPAVRGEQAGRGGLDGLSEPHQENGLGDGGDAGQGQEVGERMGRREVNVFPFAVSSVKQGSFLCTDVVQRKMRQKGKTWKTQAGRLEIPPTSPCCTYPIAFLLKKMCFSSLPVHPGEPASGQSIPLPAMQVAKALCFNYLQLAQQLFTGSKGYPDEYVPADNLVSLSCVSAELILKQPRKGFDIHLGEAAR